MESLQFESDAQVFRLAARVEELEACMLTMERRGRQRGTRSGGAPSSSSSGSARPIIIYPSTRTAAIVLDRHFAEVGTPSPDDDSPPTLSGAVESGPSAREQWEEGLEDDPIAEAVDRLVYSPGPVSELDAEELEARELLLRVREEEGQSWAE